MNIRTETEADIEAIRHVETTAFGRSDEAMLVDLLRRNDALILSLVAEQAGELIGHVAFSVVTVEQNGSNWTALALAPIAVLPEYQNQGIGSALVEAGLDHCGERGYSLAFVVGHPKYYPRFGFQAAVPLGFGSVYVPDKSQHEHFMVVELNPNALDGKSGFVRFRPEFDTI